MNARKQVLLVCLIFVSYFTSFMLVSAMDLQLAPLDGSGYLQPSTSFNYSFIFSDSNTCAPVIYREDQIVSTNQHGYAYINLTTGNFTQTTTYLCEYRNSTLRVAHIIPSLVVQNITASYYIGDGSLLTGLAGGGDILSVNTPGPYLSGGATSGAVDLLVNETYLNSTITSIASNYGNSSFNQTLTDSLYATAGAGNSSFNQSLTDTLYADISVVDTDTTYSHLSNFTNNLGFWNSTFALFNKTYADSLYADISVTGDNSTWSQSLADSLYADISVTGGNSSFNQTLTDSLYYLITNPFGFYNSTDFSITDYYSITNPFAFYNSTTFPYTHLTNFTDDLGYNNITHLSNLTNDLGFSNYSHLSNFTDDILWTAEFNATGDALWSSAGNSSFNQTLTDSLYYLLTNPFGFYNSTDFSITDYYSITNPFGFYNSTTFPYTHLTNFTNDLGYNNYSHLSNFTDDVFGNSTIARIGDCPTGQWIQNITTGGVECLAPTLSESDPLWTDNFTAYNLTWSTDTTYTNGSAINLTGTEFSLTVCGDNEIWKMNGASWNCEADAEGAGTAGAFTNITNFTGTLTNGKICIYDSSQQIINCTYTDQTGASGSVKHGDGIYLYNDTDTMYLNETKLNITIDLRATGLGDNSSFNESYTNGLYYLLTNPFEYYNSTDFSITDYYSITNPYGFWNSTNFPYTHLSNFTNNLGLSNYSHLTNFTDDLGDRGYTNNLNFTNGANYWNDTYATFNKTYADTLYAGISSGNSSWNESYASTLYRLQSWDNITGIPHATPSNGDTTHYSLADEIYDWVIGLAYTSITDIVASIGNWSADKSSYSTTTEADLLYAPINYGDDWNKTYADTLYAGISSGNSSFNQSLTDTLYYEISNPYGFWNSTFALFNKTYADTLYADISVTGDDTSWNKTYADTLYYDLGNSYGYYNSTNPQPDSNLTEDEIEAYIFDDDNTANLNMSTYNITMGGCTQYWNGTCLFFSCPTTISIQC